MLRDYVQYKRIIYWNTIGQCLLKFSRNSTKMFFILKYEYDKLYTYIKIILNRKRKIIRKRKLTLNDRLLEETEDDRYFEISWDSYRSLFRDIERYYKI